MSSAQYDAVGTLVRHSNDPRRSTGAGRRAPAGRGMQVLAWTLVACSVLVITLGATATLMLLKADSDAIPQVTDISAELTGTRVEFSWADPGLDEGDTYTITTSDGGSSVQSQPSFTVAATPGDQACITVTVDREGKLGEPSVAKCVDVPQ